MKKEYLKPEVELVSLVIEEAITTEGDDVVDGEVGVESSIF